MLVTANYWSCMLSDSNLVKEQKRAPKRRAIADPHARWSDNQKIEAVTTYLILGVLTQVSRTLGIPIDTLNRWKATSWWKDLELELRNQEKLVLGNRLKHLVEKSLNVVEDRLDKGDFVWDQKAQALVRKPVSMKDAQKVATDFMDRKHQLVTTEAHTIAEEGVKEKLEKLAKSFEEFASKQLEKPPVQVTDVVFLRENEPFAEESAQAEES